MISARIEIKKDRLYIRLYPETDEDKLNLVKIKHDEIAIFGIADTPTIECILKESNDSRNYIKHKEKEKRNSCPLNSTANE